MFAARLAQRDGVFRSEREHNWGTGMTAVFGSPPVTGFAPSRSGVIRALRPNHDSGDRNTIRHHIGVDACDVARNITIATNAACAVVEMDN